MPVYKRKNENFFKIWSAPMAYVLGFIAADGAVIKNNRGAHFLEIQSIDKEIVEKIKTAFKSNLSIGEYQPKNKNYNKRYRLQIGSKEIYSDLIKLGITPRKSKTITLPNIPSVYFSHFLRGYFDGDGCVNICTYQKRDRKKLSTVLTCTFTSGSQDILTSIHKKLHTMNIVTGGTICYHSQAYRLLFSIRDSLALYRFMYNNAEEDLYLTRKRKVFERFTYAGVAQPG